MRSVRGIDGNRYEAVESRLGTIEFRPRRSPEELRAFYRSIPPLSAPAGERQILADARRILRELDALGIQPPGAMLEIGPAHGFKMVAAREAGWTVTGLDLAPSNYALVHGKYGLDVRQGDAHGAASVFGEKAFDVVGMWEVMEHLLQPDVTLAHVLRLLRPGGWLVGTTPNARSLHRFLAPASWRRLHCTPPGHLQLFSIADLRDRLSAAGFVDARFGSARTLSGPTFSLGVRRRLPRLARPLTRLKALTLGSLDRVIRLTGLPPEHIFFAARRPGPG